MKDLISRQAVLNLLHALPPEEAMTKTMLIQSVQQMDAPDNLVKDSQGLAKELVNDTISRQAAIHAICRDGVRLERGGALMITISTAKQWAVDLLGELPSVRSERKRGKWNGYNMDKGGWKRTDGSPVFLICSECGGTVLNNGSASWNFCPHCGSEMREWDDERSD